MNSYPKVFVIVVTYCGRQWYNKCFTSLRVSSLPVNTIVVDNTPGFEDVNYIRKKFPEIHLIKPETNLGFGRGNNLGIKYALEHDADYIFLLNQDTWLCDSKMFDKLINVSITHPEFGILSPLHLKSDEKTINMMLEHKTGTTSFAILVDLYKNTIKDVYSTNYINAAAWLLPRITIDIVGGFNPMFSQYGEDDDYLNRVLYHKLKVGVCPNICLVHDHQNTVLPFADNKSKYFHQLEILVRLNNINYTSILFNQINHLIKKIFCSIITFKYVDLKIYVSDLFYVIKNFKMVRYCRYNNRMIQRSWL